MPQPNRNVALDLSNNIIPMKQQQKLIVVYMATLHAHSIGERLVAAGLESRALLSDAVSEPLVKSEPARHPDAPPEGDPTPKPRQ